MRSDRKGAPVLITDAPESPDQELHRRERRYVAMMLLRAASLIAAAVIISTKPPLWGVWVAVCVVAVVFLPWFAVLLANDRPPKTRAERAADARPRPGGTPESTAQPALPTQATGRVIDPD